MDALVTLMFSMPVAVADAVAPTAPASTNNGPTWL